MLPGIAALMVARKGSGVPYVQRVQYSPIATQSTTHTVTFTSTPVSGHFLAIFISADLGTITTPSGWTLDSSKASGTHNLYAYHKIAGASEPTGIAFTISTASIVCAVGYEFVIPGGNTGGLDDQGVVILNEAVATNNIGSVGTASVVDLIFAVASYYNTNHNDTGDGPFSFDSGFVQQGYAIATHTGTSGISIEIVVAFRKSSAIGSYNTNITATNTEAGTNGPGLIVAYN